MDWLKRFQKGGKVSTEGYRKNSPDRFNDYNIIPTGHISMQNVDFPVFGVDNHGNSMTMMPGNEYKFPGQYVTEVPMKQAGGSASPIYVGSYNDPRYKSYQDSVTAYNKSKALLNKYNTTLINSEDGAPLNPGKKSGNATVFQYRDNPNARVIVPNPVMPKQEIRVGYQHGSINRVNVGDAQPISIQSPYSEMNSVAVPNMPEIHGDYDLQVQNWNPSLKEQNYNKRDMYFNSDVERQAYIQSHPMHRIGPKSFELVDKYRGNVASQYAEGGISPDKAKEMLHNPPHGIPLTDKQRKYFGYIASQKYQYGGQEKQLQKDIEFLNSFTPQQIAINQLQARNRVPAIGEKATWQDKMRNAKDFTHHLPTGAMQDIVGNAINMATYPSTAAINLTQPSRYFEGKSNKLEGVQDMFMDVVSAVPLMKLPMKGVSKYKAAQAAKNLEFENAFRDKVNQSQKVVYQLGDMPAVEEPVPHPNAYKGRTKAEIEDLRNKLEKSQREGREQLQRGLKMEDTYFENPDYHQTANLSDVIHDPDLFHPLTGKYNPKPGEGTYYGNPGGYDLFSITPQSDRAKMLNYLYPENYMKSGNKTFLDYMSSKSAQQRYGGQQKTKINKSTYMPHPRMMKNGGQTNDWLNNF